MSAIPLDDRGLLLGDGLFETLLVVAGAPQALDAHLERLARGCVILGLPAPEPAGVASAIGEAVFAAGLAQGRAAVRVNWSAGSGGRGLDRPDPPAPRLWVTAAPAPRLAGPCALATVATRRNEGSPASRLKTLSYVDSVLARREAQAAGADEALMLNNGGEVACAAAANLFWIAGGALLTPALDCGVLDGVMRGAVLARAPALGVTAREVRAMLADLAQAEGMFLTNSLIGLRPVARLDGRPIPSHPLLDPLTRACADLGLR